MSVQGDIHLLADKFEIEYLVLISILEHFDELNFIGFRPFLGGGFELTIRVSAHDFMRRGGFVVQEELFLKNIEKLLAEIDKLKAEFPEKVDFLANISAIGSFILSGLKLLK